MQKIAQIAGIIKKTRAACCFKGACEQEPTGQRIISPDLARSRDGNELLLVDTDGDTDTDPE